MPEERITGSKIDLDLSAGSIYTRVYTLSVQLSSILFEGIGTIEVL